MSRRILIKRDTTSNWASNNPVLLEGELGLDTTLDKMKMGNGTSAWLDLPFITVADVSTLALTSQLSSYMPSSYLDTDGYLAADSDSKVPSQKAVKTYVDGYVTSAVGGVISDATPSFKNILDITSSQTWTVPASVGRIRIFAVGGGGNGSRYSWGGFI